MNQNLRLSIIIPMYNAERYITRCIDSCFDQDMEEDSFEVIVIDDGSTDKSYSVVENLKDRHSNLRLFHQNNQGQGAARNLGINLAKGDYLEFLDSDDYLLPKSILSVLCKAETKSAEIIRFLMDVEEADGTVKYCYENPKLEGIVLSGEKAIYSLNNFGSVCECLYYRDFISKNMFLFRTDIKHEDVAFNYSVFPFVKRFVFYNIHCYHYCFNGVSTDRNMSKENLRRLLLADLKIAELLKEVSENKSLTQKLRTYYWCISNSMVVSTIFESLLKRAFSLKKILNIMYASKLIPISGQTLSWKTSCLIPFINIICKLKK